MAKILAIDLGTTYCKFALLDRSGRLPGSIYQVIGADIWLSGRVAADIGAREIAERRVAYRDIRE